MMPSAYPLRLLALTSLVTAATWEVTEEFATTDSIFIETIVSNDRSTAETKKASSRSASPTTVASTSVSVSTETTACKTCSTSGADINQPLTSFETILKTRTTTAAPVPIASPAQAAEEEEDEVHTKTVYQVVTVNGDSGPQLPAPPPPPPPPPPQPVPAKSPDQIAAEAGAMKALNFTSQLWHTRLNKTEYYKRNFMWIRCLDRSENRFEAGGSWVDDWGKRFLKEVQKSKCGPINFHAAYLNGQGWGDIRMSFNWFWEMMCNQKQALKRAIKASEEHQLEFRRELYVYDCAGFENEPWSFDDVPMQRAQFYGE